MAGTDEENQNSSPNFETGEQSNNVNSKKKAAFQKKERSLKIQIFVLIQVLVLLLLLGFLVASLLVQVLKSHILGGLEIWKWCIFAMSVLCGFTLVFWAYWPVMFFIEKAFALETDVIYFVYGLRKSGAFFIWWVWVLLMWLILLEQPIHKASPRATKALNITTRTVISLAVVAFAWILLTIGLRLLSVKCRFNRYIKKIQDASFHMYLLRTLSEKQENGNSHVDCCPNVNEETLDDHWFKSFHTFNSGTLGFLNSDFNIIDLEEERLERSTCEETPDISTDDVRNKARRIFENVVEQRTQRTPGSEWIITLSDLSRFLLKNENLTDEAIFKKEIIQNVLKLFNATETKTIHHTTFTNWMIQLYQDRKILVQALNDNKTATKRLNILLRAILVILATFGWLIWIDILTTKLLAVFLTSLVGWAFIFGDSVKMTFQSIIFIFLVHPFDIGDTCMIDKTQLVVEQMNILTTVFLNENNEKTYFSNYELSTKVISNLSRSSFVSDSVRFTVDMRTSIEKIATLKETIKSNLKMSSLTVEGFDGQGSIEMTLRFSHQKIQDNEATTDKKTEVILQLVKSLQNLNIMYGYPPTEDVNASAHAWKPNPPEEPYHPHSN